MRDRNSLLGFSAPPMIIILTEERFLWSTTGEKKKNLFRLLTLDLLARQFLDVVYMALKLVFITA